MSSKKTQLTHHENVTIERHFMAAPGDVALEDGVTIVVSELNRQSPIVPRLRLKLTDFVVTVPNADNFGATKLLTLADNNLEFKWAVVDLAAVVLGFTTNTVAAVDLALGTAEMASTDFSGAGEDDITEKIDGVGAGATGTVKGVSTDALRNVLIAAGTNAIWVNVSDPVTSGDGTLTLNGYIELTLRELGKPS